MDVDFHQLTNLAQKHDYEALYRLKYVAATIIKTWAKREKQELKWMASNEKTVDYSCIIDCIIEQLITGNRGDLLKELTFPQFKTFLIETFRNRMAACFSVFLSLLKGSHDQAWQIVFNDLENHSAAWFYKNRLSVKYNCHAIFSEAFEILYSNYIEKDLEFRDSCAFKSYFFKILENKQHEEHRRSSNAKVLSFNSKESSSVVQPDCEQTFDNNEKQQMIKMALLKLKGSEREIITEYYYAEKKLKDIAAERGQTEENVRIQKYRALKKLYKYMKYEGYGS